MPNYSISQWTLLTHLADMADLYGTLLDYPTTQALNPVLGGERLMDRVTGLVLELASECLAEGLTEEVAMIDRAHGGRLLIDCCERRSAGPYGIVNSESTLAGQTDNPHRVSS
jgi:hypothetical protein